MVRIFIEAKKAETSECVFLSSYLHHLGIGEEAYDIVCVDGKDNLARCRNKFLENTIEGGINLIVFDADRPDTKGGFESRKAEITALLEDLAIEAELFLFPCNSEDGIFENLLERLMQTERHKQFLDCYHDYELCLGSDYIAPNTKGKVFTYISSQKELTRGQRKKLGSGQWLFEDARYWDLDNDCLLPLKEFLLTHFARI